MKPPGQSSLIRLTGTRFDSLFVFSTGVTWALHAMTQAPEIQAKLREELLSIPTENPSMEELSSLPYLDIFIRETLRFYSPVPDTVRVAKKDDIIPLNTPYTDTKGQEQHSIR